MHDLVALCVDGAHRLPMGGRRASLPPSPPRAQTAPAVYELNNFKGIEGLQVALGCARLGELARWVRGGLALQEALRRLSQVPDELFRERHRLLAGFVSSAGRPRGQQVWWRVRPHPQPTACGAGKRQNTGLRRSFLTCLCDSHTAPADVSRSVRVVREILRFFVVKHEQRDRFRRVESHLPWGVPGSPRLPWAATRQHPPRPPRRGQLPGVHPHH